MRDRKHGLTNATTTMEDVGESGAFGPVEESRSLLLVMYAMRRDCSSAG